MSMLDEFAQWMATREVDPIDAGKLVKQMYLKFAESPDSLNLFHTYVDGVGQFTKSVIQDRKVENEIRVLMIGLAGGGKTTVLYEMKLGELVTTIPTIGFNVETVEVRGASFVCWDVGGQDKIRPLWRHYYQKTHMVMYVVDATRMHDKEFEQENWEELQKVLREEEMEGIPLCVLFTKTDSDRGRMDFKEVCDVMGRRLAPELKREPREHTMLQYNLPELKTVEKSLAQQVQQLSDAVESSGLPDWIPTKGIRTIIVQFASPDPPTAFGPLVWFLNEVAPKLHRHAAIEKKMEDATKGGGDISPKLFAEAEAAGYRKPLPPHLRSAVEKLMTPPVTEPLHVTLKRRFKEEFDTHGREAFVQQMNQSGGVGRW